MCKNKVYNEVMLNKPENKKRLFNCSNSAFTLAEVLITLAVIGIVAAMTMPNLLSLHRKKIAETRLAKFYSVMNQAIIMSEVDNGPKEFWDDQDDTWITDENGDIVSSGMAAWFSKYFDPYIQTLDTKINTDFYEGRMFIYFSDGSLLIMGSKSWLYIIESKYLNITDTVKNDSTISYLDYSDSGTKWFTFYFNPSSTNKYYKNKGVEPYKGSWNGTREMLLNNTTYGCNKNATKEKAYCAALIQINGWKIPNDYPLKF